MSGDRKSVLSWLPAEDWEIFDNDRETILNAYDKDESFRIECTTAIAANGYTLTESGTAPDGTYYEKYENNNGCLIGVLFQSANGYVGLEIIW